MNKGPQIKDDKILVKMRTDLYHDEYENTTGLVWNCIERKYRNNRNVLESFDEIPEGFVFGRDTVFAWLDSVLWLPENVKFENSGYIDLNSITEIPETTVFMNDGGSVSLLSIKEFPDHADFSGARRLYLNETSSFKIEKDYENLSSLDYIVFKNYWDGSFRTIDLNLNPNIKWNPVNGKVQMYESWVKNNY